MSGIYISGMEMSKNYPICIVIDVSGQARKYDLVNDKYTNDEVFEANNVPDHGRCIDADTLNFHGLIKRACIDYIESGHSDYYMGVNDGIQKAAKKLSTAPTIIPADQEEEA